MFSPFHHTGKDAGKPASSARPAPWTFCWDELLTADPDKASKFYSAVFGWDIETMEMPNFGTYTLLKRKGVKDETGADKNAGGIMKLPPSVPHPFWLAYVAVPDCDAVVAKATKLGGVVPMPPMDIPDVGRIATILDPQQVPIAVLAPKR